MRVLAFLLIYLFCLPQSPYAAEALRNADSLDLRQGVRVVLPDQSIVTIEEQDPQGNWQATEGIVISEYGEILSGKFKGRHVELARELSVADLLTDMPVIEEPAPKPKEKAPEKQSRRSEPSPGKKEGSPAKPESPVESPQVSPGQPLRIPDSAIQTGNLAFLEGCWQGTRPEYFSKRTIKECFCFDSQGRTGKRRIYDITYSNRQCISAARANMSSNGVLHVTSDAAVCNDGEQWGSAQMQCQNSGPQTPCSWIFPMAGHGQQSYVIPFVRVEACGR